MASTTLTSDLATLAPVSESRQNHLSRPPPPSFTTGSAAFAQGSFYEDPESSQPGRASMSLNMSQGARDGYAPQPATSFRPYEANGSMMHGNAAPQIYSAVYSGVDVYEMEVNKVAVMRRRKDSWLNATQILKVAGIEKGKRTKVLEKEILIGDHEKVQGGYGKYQGTWIKFERGLEFCRQYGVEDILRPLLTYDMGQDGGVAGQGSMETPTKEQAMAAQRKRMYNTGMEGRQNTSGTPSFFKNISSTASHAVAAISKARLDSPGPRNRDGSMSGRPPSFSRRPSQQQLPQDFPGGSQQSMHSVNSVETAYMNGHDTSFQGASQFSQHDAEQGMGQEPPRKKIRPSSSMDYAQTHLNGDGPDTRMRDPSPTEANESFMYQSNMHAIAEHPDPSLPMPMPTTQSAVAKKGLLMSLFTDPARADFTHHEAFRTLAAADLDMPIDASSHTALHWAATLARIPLLKMLIQSGASIYRVNRGGETALMRACVVTNNLDMGSFAELLELLGPSIDVRDSRGRTVLHHIAITSAVKGRSQASKYYLESLLEFVVRQGSAPNSQQALSNGMQPERSISIGRFMSEVVNVQDKSGDTALNIAARIGVRSIISQLLEVGADATIMNGSRLRPIDFGIGDPNDVNARIGGASDTAQRPAKESRENSSQIIDSITSLLSQTSDEFATELAAKQNTIDTIHKKLRESSGLLGEERRRLESLRSRRQARQDRALQINNLRRAAEEESARLNALSQQYGPASTPSQSRLAVGDADKDYAVPAAASSAQTNVLANMNLNHSSHAPAPLDATHRQLLGSLPGAPELQARVAVYTANNAALEASVRTLQSKSAELAGKYRRIVALCTKTPEERVDELVEGLLRAVESERDDVEIGRVREFLQRVEAVE